MKNGKKMLAAVLFIGLLMPYSISSAHGHHQDTHHNNSNSGKYHYNCGGHQYPAHLHKNGACPYSKKCSVCYRTSTIKKVQKKLNRLGYSCGKTGYCDKKTKSAIRKYQKKKCIAVNGKINETLLKKMNIAHK